jgi:hypothetical protein
MKSRTIVILAAVALLVLLWAMGNAVAGPPRQGPEGEGDVTIAGTVAEKISYQGRLTDAAGNPLDGTYTMRFRLYDAETGGTMLWDSGDQSVSVDEGLFNVKLDIDHSDFNGQGLWIEVQVGNETLSPRQEILPVPYALSLRPGAVISDTMSYVQLNRSYWFAKYGVYAKAAGIYGGAGVYGESDSTFGEGVYGYASATSGETYGVYGKSESPQGYGIYGTAPITGTVGIATATSGETYGVYGKSESFYGRGVYGYASHASGINRGVYGLSNSTRGRGVYGEASATEGTTYGVVGVSKSPSGYGGHFRNEATSGETYGVYGESDSSEGYGVYGTAPTTGTVGIATATSGRTYGVYGESDSTSGRGVYGRASATSGTTYGVYGESDSTSGRGVYGHASAESGATRGVYGRSDSTSGRGVYGWASATSGTTYGVYGYASSPSGYGGSFANSASGGVGLYARGYGRWDADLVLGGTSSTNDEGCIYSDPEYNSSDIWLFSHDGVVIRLDKDDNEEGHFEVRNGADDIVFKVDENGNMTAEGTKSAAVGTRKYGTRKMYAIESTEVWFEDFGTAQLTDGVAIIEIDPIFAETVNLEVGYHVFLTPVGGWAPLYVTNKTPTSFEVRDADGKANVAFDYRIVAKRLGYEDLRMEPMVLTSEEEEK